MTKEDFKGDLIAADLADDDCSAEFIAEKLWPRIEETIKEARSPLKDSYLFDAGFKDGRSAGLDKAATVVNDFLKVNGLENDVKFADIFEALKEAKHES